ncbi:MAG: hypothetical protein C0497_04900 [Gemmatimonas sp.]|nr:hypothetical protein [Gemmatimonas sp.]
MSSGRDHSAGGAEPLRGSEVAITSGIGVATTGATMVGGAELAHPMPEEQDRHDGVFPSGVVQQSALLTVAWTVATCSVTG